MSRKTVVTEYEELLSGMIVEKKEKLEALKSPKGRSNRKKMEALEAEIRFIEVELERYQHGMVLFRSKDLPKVGRWGKPVSGEQGEALP